VSSSSCCEKQENREAGERGTRGSTGIQGSVPFQCHAALPVPSPGHAGVRRSPASQETSQLYLNRKKEVFSVIQCPGSTLFTEHDSTWHPGAREPGPVRWRTGVPSPAGSSTVERCCDAAMLKCIRVNTAS